MEEGGEGPECECGLALFDCNDCCIERSVEWALGSVLPKQLARLQAAGTATRHFVFQATLNQQNEVGRQAADESRAEPEGVPADGTPLSILLEEAKVWKLGAEIDWECAEWRLNCIAVCCEACCAVRHAPGAARDGGCGS
ncbi:hypothetical protein JYU34_003340 [Plutella xylostella]|uniref:Uncharacterized protein n=1 Tax=Plutella xylostella TaxID=51655 RepID=A0ABQ7QZU3_PLUXY|nr:hypothetical protein JYU34_003340 [Plutella xylostella]